jgi:U3 small nucleolar RNA-associated protein 18
MPSTRVFSNWPTDQTPLHYVNSFDFSSDSNYLALGNDRGHVILYKLNYFANLV